MKMKRLFCIVLVLALVLGFFNFSVLATEKEEASLKVLPYGKMKLVKSTGILSGISPKTEVETVLKGFENPESIEVYD